MSVNNEPQADVSENNALFWHLALCQFDNRDLLYPPWQTQMTIQIQIKPSRANISIYLFFEDFHDFIVNTTVGQPLTIVDFIFGVIGSLIFPAGRGPNRFRNVY